MKNEKKKKEKKLLLSELNARQMACAFLLKNSKMSISLFPWDPDACQDEY